MSRTAAMRRTGGFALLVIGLLCRADAPARADILYVSASEFDNTIAKFPIGGARSIFADASSGLKNPYGLAFDSAGNLYAANYVGNTIEKFTPDGVGSVFASSRLNAPVGLAFDSAGNLYAANSGSNTIEKFTLSGVGSVFASSGLNAPVGLAFDRAGNLYAGNDGDDTIEKFTPDGVGSVFASSGVSDPVGLAFDSAGNLYVANFVDNTIEKFTPDGVGSVFARLPHPAGLAFDSAGNLYAGNGSNTNDIEKFTPGGVGSDAGYGNENSDFLAFTDDAGVPLLQNIPEPSVCALLCVGIPVLLTARRRKAIALGTG